MHPFIRNLQQQATENPMVALALGVTVLATVTKFLGANVEARNSRVWAQEVARRTMKDAVK
jgi:hypothetical protein